MSDDLEIATDEQSNLPSALKPAESPSGLKEPESSTREFRWTQQKHRAAVLIARNDLKLEEIAKSVGAGYSTLWGWRKHPAFIAQVEKESEEFRKEIRSRGIAILENRLADLQDLRDRLKQIIKERSEDPEMQDVPGGKTGMLIHNVKVVGSGENAEMIDLYEPDVGLAREIEALNRQAAQELGQWAEKRELSGPGGGPIETKHSMTPDMSKLSLEELNAFESLLTKASGDAPSSIAGGETSAVPESA